MRKYFLFTIYIFCLTFSGFAQKTHTATRLERPKIIIGLVVDQMRWDYLYRYFERYGNGGFKRLLQKGYSFENTFIPYTPAVTAAGHASIYTGSVAALNGMVGNSWIERKDDTYMYCVQDTSVNTVGSNSIQGEMSPRNLLATTVGDELRIATNFRSRVYGISLKDRGGILPAGRSGNAAYWFDDNTGNWITSTWYMNQLPAWVNSFNSSRRIDSMMMHDWNLLYPKSTYTQSTADDKGFEKLMVSDSSRTFPHVYKNLIGKNYYGFRTSPYGNTFSFDFAKQLINSERLGSGKDTDMLCLSLSSTDYIGHLFGPNSLEIEDTYLRLDQDIERFLKYLDARFGNEYLIFLSADHGAPPVPDFMKENKISAGHLNAYYAVKDSLNKIGLQQFGVANIVKSVLEYQVYFNNRLIDSLKLSRQEINKSFISFFLKQPEVLTAFDYANFQNAVLPVKIKNMLANGYYHARSGDIQFILKPGYTDVNSRGTEHGTIFNYDTHIPLVWFGWNIKPGKTNTEVYMTDIAPTISALLKIQMPNACVGRVLMEIVK